MNPKYLYAVEVSGACNLEATCKWCPMHNRPRSRPRGLMSDDTVKRALHWASKLRRVEALALHVFGEPLLHPRFPEIALEFAKVNHITMSTNGVLMTPQWADKLAVIPWAWISISPWNLSAMHKSWLLLAERGIKCLPAPGVTHSFATQAEGPKVDIFTGCEFLMNNACVIRWDGSIATCCISDREEDAIGHVSQEPEEMEIRKYEICDSCHMGKQ